MYSNKTDKEVDTEKITHPTSTINFPRAPCVKKAERT